MIVVVDARELVRNAYAAQFDREGYPASGFCVRDFELWVESATETEIAALNACLVADGDFEHLGADCLARIRAHLRAPLMVLADRANLASTLRWFERGAADVVRKPVHVRELLARIAVHGRRVGAPSTDNTRLRVFGDGRDPLVDGRPLALPRRERRILEHLAAIDGRRATKAQLYDAVYGLFGEAVEEVVIESHISKLRKKLRAALGHDPIDSKRYLGYCLHLPEAKATRAARAA